MAIQLDNLDDLDLGSVELLMSTDKGDMVFGFYGEQAPGHARNIIKLALEGFYDGLAFHRIIKGFMIQGGCPNTRKGATGHPGTGGPGYQIRAEFSDLPHKRGVLSMARAQDPDSAGSQFFVVHSEHASFLDGNYTVFAYMKSGEDVLDAIASSEVGFGPGGEESKPKERIEIRSMTVRQAEDATPEGDAAAGEDAD